MDLNLKTYKATLSRVEVRRRWSETEKRHTLNDWSFGHESI